MDFNSGASRHFSSCFHFPCYSLLLGADFYLNCFWGAYRFGVESYSGFGEAKALDSVVSVLPAVQRVDKATPPNGGGTCNGMPASIGRRKIRLWHGVFAPVHAF